MVGEIEVATELLGETTALDEGVVDFVVGVVVGAVVGAAGGAVAGTVVGAVVAVEGTATVVGGGDVRTNSEIDEEVILNLEREAFIDFLKQEKTLARIEHMLKTGKPLRN